MLRTTHKIKILGLTLALISTLAASVVLSPAVSAAPIPPGCPGSTQAGPPAPGVCEAIPPGCPGSTQAGPPAPNTTCPYEASTAQDATNASFNTGDPEGQYQCGKGSTTIKTSINFGCKGNSYQPSNPSAQLNPILDLVFALLRFLTIGVGIVAIGSVIVGGIQFTTSQGDPAATAKAIGRISSTVGALFLYLLIWAIMNWLIPGGIFNG